MARENWFKQKEKQEDESESLSNGMNLDDRKVKAINKDYVTRLEQTTVMFVPNTKGSILLKRLQAMEDEMAKLTGFRIKFQEAGGIQLCRMFRKNLARDQLCGRVKCWPCKSIKEGATKKCKQRSILYESSCVLCNPEKSGSSLEGEDNITSTDGINNTNPSTEQDMAGPSPTPPLRG